MKNLKRKTLIAAAAIMMFSAPFATAAEGEMTGEELSALLGAGKKINLGGGREDYSGVLDIKSDGTASGSVQVPGKTIPLDGTWKIADNRFCRKWREVDAGAEVCEVWKKIGDGRVEAQVNGKKVGLNWW